MAGQVIHHKPNVAGRPKLRWSGWGPQDPCEKKRQMERSLDSGCNAMSSSLSALWAPCKLESHMHKSNRPCLFLLLHSVQCFDTYVAWLPWQRNRCKFQRTAHVQDNSNMLAQFKRLGLDSSVMLWTIGLCHYQWTFNRRMSFLTSKLNIEHSKKLVRCYVWSIALYGSETWILRNLEPKYLMSFQIWWWRRMEKAKCSEAVTNAKYLTVQERRGHF